MSRAQPHLHSPIVNNERPIAIAIPATSNRSTSIGYFAILVALTATFLVASLARGAAPEPLQTGTTETNPGAEAAKTEAQESFAIIAGGCFWCTEAVFERMEGVGEVVSGYIGGRNAFPTYQQICTGRTGHAEAVQVFFDPEVTSFEEILEVFFKTHDPTTLNRQGVDTGTQYRSAIFYQNEEQKKISLQYIAKLNKEGGFRNRIVTKLERPTKFYPAEEYHQDYFAKNPNAAYCQRVVVEKVQKFNQHFGDKIKKE